MTDPQKQIDSLREAVGAYAESSGRFEAAPAAKITNIEHSLDKISGGVDKIQEDYVKVWSKLTNGMTDKLIDHDIKLKESVKQCDLTNAMQSIRNEIRTFKWFVGILMSAGLGLIVAGQFL